MNSSSLSYYLNVVPAYAFYVVAITSFLAFIFFANKRSDPYGTFHHSLNKLPGEDPNAPPKTEWLNMGYWKVSARDLRSCLSKGSPDVRRPSKLSGITSLPAHHQRSRDRIASMRLRNPDISEPKLYLGDAVYRLGREDHPLSPNNADMYDSILALDCAYHFHTRRDFLRQSLSHLAPGGRIALADICFPMSWKTMSLGTRALLTILKVIPMENIVSLDEYEADMRNMGYVDVKVEDISEEVFPGFIRFLKSRGWGWWIFGKVMSEFAGRARFVVVSGCAAA
ncbi:S-adenosyl-L-methionine-dependent methyltransferase [Armillaria nabsnona]|nr:S-adenosyl-L-methionine-dependent methyltransferase [Armillaria nabsnona]